MNSNTDNTRKMYIRPAVEQVKLVAEEAVLSNCKDGLGVGGQATCQSAGDQGCTSVGRS